MLPVAKQEALLFTNKADDRVSVTDEMLASGHSAAPLTALAWAESGFHQGQQTKVGRAWREAAESPGSSKNESLGILSAGVCLDRPVQP